MLKNDDFLGKNQRFWSIFSHLVNACWPHVHRTCNPTLGIGGTYLVPFYPKQFGHTTNTRLVGWRKPFFASGVDSRNNHFKCFKNFPKKLKNVQNHSFKMFFDFCEFQPEF